jgi:hypothetical protein
VIIGLGIVGQNVLLGNSPKAFSRRDDVHRSFL